MKLFLVILMPLFSFTLFASLGDECFKAYLEKGASLTVASKECIGF
jgi:hypothetical protein